jgi:hypothetical protein
MLAPSLLQCQSLPISFLRAVRRENVSYIVTQAYKRPTEMARLSRSVTLHSAGNISAEGSVYKNKAGHNSKQRTVSRKFCERHKHALYKLWGRGRAPSVGVTSFQRQHLRRESWSSKNKIDHSSMQWIFSRKYCFTQSAYLTSSLQTEGGIQEKAILSVMFFVFNIL